MSIFFSTGSDREELQPLLDNYFGCEFYGPKNTSRGIRGHSDKVLSFYKKYPKKDSHEMEIPKRILKSDFESKMNFIGGQIDSDGSIGNGSILLLVNLIFDNYNYSFNQLGFMV